MTTDKHFWESVLDHIDQLIYVTDIKTGEILFISQKMEQTFGLTDARGKICFKELYSGKERRCDFCPVHRLNSSTDRTVVWEDYDSVTGRYFKNTGALMEWSDGRIVHIRYMADMTVQKESRLKIEELQRQIKGQDAWTRAIMEACPIGCHFFNDRYELADCNQAAVRLFGYDTKEVYLNRGVGKVCSRLRPEQALSEEEIRNFFRKVKKEGSGYREFLIESVDGTGIPCQVTLIYLKEAGSGGYVSYLRDLREIEEKNERIEQTERKNNFDHLTGIYSRSFFMEESQLLLDYCNRQEILFGVILLSLDGFRIINSDFGREAGDRTLCVIAETMRKNKKLKQGQVYARFNGSKFLIGLIGYDQSGAWKLAEELREEIESLRFRVDELDEEPLHLTVSMGIAIRSDYDKQLVEILYEAENAMYDARLSGGNCVRLFDEANDEIVAITHFL